MRARRSPGRCRPRRAKSWRRCNPGRASGEPRRWWRSSTGPWPCRPAAWPIPSCPRAATPTSRPGASPSRSCPRSSRLDPDEFVRRFAGRELLYFHREEPRTPAARELLLVIDQGVRTWGDVRLVLAAAVLALGKQATRRELVLTIATTGNRGQPVNAVDAGALGLGELLEASDLSPHPAIALGRALGSVPSEPGPRDVVLLTNPRSLAEPEVVEAARNAGDATRLFAVAVGIERRGRALGAAPRRAGRDRPLPRRPGAGLRGRGGHSGRADAGRRVAGRRGADRVPVPPRGPVPVPGPPACLR